jgi:hypothetical protein
VVHVCHAADSDVEGFAGKLEYINLQQLVNGLLLSAWYLLR